MSSNENFFAGGGSLVPRLVAVEQQVSQFFAGEVAKEVSFPTWYTPPSIYVEKNGTILSKAAYPALWNAVSSSAITSAAYDAVVAASPIGACSQYADIDATTFKVPTVGQGGFSKAVGTNGFDIGTEDGGFNDQIQNHKHANGLVDGTGQLRPMFAYEPQTDFYIYGYTTVGAAGGDISGDIMVGLSGATNYVTSPVNTDTRAALTSSSLHDVSGETSPQGVYNRVWIYTGNIVSNLPEPEPDWLAQQQANTDAIADIKAGIHIEAGYNGTGNKEWRTYVTFTSVTGGSLSGGRVVIPEDGVYLLTYGFYDSQGKSGTSLTRLGFAVNSSYAQLPLVGAAPYGGSMSHVKRLSAGDLVSVAAQSSSYYFWAHSSRDHNYMTVTKISD